MIPRKCLSAYTPSTGYKYYPPYLNISIEGEQIIVTVRAREDEEGCGKTVSMEIPKEIFQEMLAKTVSGLTEETSEL
jgi:hypothetical protein